MKAINGYSAHFYLDAAFGAMCVAPKIIMTIII